MKNPGLSAFSAATMYAERPRYVHPRDEDIRPDDPDYDPDHEDDPSDFTEGRDFGRWKEHGTSIRVPTIHQGPNFHAENMPEDIVHGDVMPEEKDSADRIVNGEHESSEPSANPYVERARRDLHTPESSDAVGTLSDLLDGGGTGDHDMDSAHDYLSRHFTDVTVNPQHGSMTATSPAGTQLVKREEAGLPAVRGDHEKALYSLTNKHGTLTSPDATHLVRSMIAFQIVHNAIAQKKEREDQDGQRRTSSVENNDLCPVCVSGYLEPYGDDHECLNCGSLVKDIGFEKAAATKRRPGGLGKGLGQLLQEQDKSDPLNLAAGGSQAEDFVTPESGHHPLANEEHDEETYQAPKRILGRVAAADDDLEKQLGKYGYQPIHKPGQERTYLAQMPGVDGGYARLTEGAPHPRTGERGWVLTADNVPTRDKWTEDGEPKRGRTVNLPVDPANPEDGRYRSQSLPDLGDRLMSEKSILASGHHPTKDLRLHYAVKDLAERGRNSPVYQRTLDTAYEPPKPVRPEPGKTQRDLRGLSSVGNPGQSRFSQSTD